MKSASILPLLGFMLIHSANAHYFFGRLILDGKWTQTWDYIRPISPKSSITNDPGLALTAPNTDPDSSDIRCGRNASTLWADIKTAKIQAGAKVGFAVGEPPVNESPYMYHPGFASAWLSKVPNGDLKSYTGDGDWVKIWSLVFPTEQSRNWEDPEWKPRKDTFKSLWGTFLLDSANFTIPATTPAGKYLLRFEHIFPNVYDAQFYVNCAHVEVINDGVTGTPGPTIKIPGAYQRGQPDVYFSTYDLALNNNFNISSFVPPKPDVWQG